MTSSSGVTIINNSITTGWNQFLLDVSSWCLLFCETNLYYKFVIKLLCNLGILGEDKSSPECRSLFICNSFLMCFYTAFYAIIIFYNLL